MKTLLFGFLMISSLSYAETKCTTEPTSKWKDQETFKKDLEKTYTIKKFKVTPGNCYEIYGFDKAGKKIEIYFNPVDGSIVKQR